jgi:hypothetical protein
MGATVLILNLGCGGDMMLMIIGRAQATKSDDRNKQRIVKQKS